MKTGPGIRILLVDDHALFRDGLGRLLEGEADLELVDCCGTMHEALQVLRKRPVDIILLDYLLEGERGSEVVKIVRQFGFKGKILMVTAGLTNSQVRELIQLGVSGVFLKHDPPASLTTCIREVVAGRTWLTPRHLQALVESDTPVETPVEKAQITERQRAVLRGVLEGSSNKEIASQLGVSESAIKAVIQQLFAKLRVRSRSQLVRAVLEGKTGTVN
jgi:two-component system nitrate/nitrite response regulator NarL